MRFALAATVIWALSGAALAQSASAPASRPAQAVELPNVGIKLSLPADFQLRAVEEPYDAIRAVQQTGEKPTLALTLSVYPVGTNTTSDSYAETMYNEMRKNLAIRYLELVKKASLTVDNLPGVAHALSYTFRGEKYTAIRVHVLREIKAPVSLRLCYVLTIEAPADRQATISPVLRQVVTSIGFIDLAHPSRLPVRQLLEPLTDRRQGYAISPPLGWQAALSPNGAEMSQTDYLAGGLAMPSANVTVKKELPRSNVETLTRKDLLDARDAAANGGYKLEVLNQGWTRLGGADAYQFMAKQSMTGTPLKTDGGEPPTIIIAHRAVVRQPDRPDENATIYKLIVIARTEDAKAVEAMMDRIAEGFSLVEIARPVKSAPTQPAWATTLSRPGAASAPASEPASGSRP